MRTRYRHRDSTTGAMVTEEYAAANPDTTQRESVKILELADLERIVNTARFTADPTATEKANAWAAVGMVADELKELGFLVDL